MKYCDYEDGTAYIILCKGDFVSESRFKAYSMFMNQTGDIIKVPIDSDRAKRMAGNVSKTNADSIRGMDDKRLAVWLACIAPYLGGQGWLDWLREESKDANRQNMQ